MDRIAVLQNLYRQFPQKNASLSFFHRVEGILQQKLGLSRAVFALRHGNNLKTVDGKSPFSLPVQKEVFVHLNRVLKPWICGPRDRSDWIGFWPVIIGKDWAGCFGLRGRRHSGRFSGEEAKLMELLADRSAFYLDERRLWNCLERAGRQSTLGFLSAGMIHEIRGPLIKRVSPAFTGEKGR